jgi:hypothetical protein
VIPDIGVNVQTVFRYRVLSHPISVSMFMTRRSPRRRAWIPQGFTKFMMRCSRLSLSAFRCGDPPIPCLQECLNLCMSWSLEGLAPLNPRAVLSVRSAPDILVCAKDSKAPFAGCLRWLSVQDLTVLVTIHSRVQPCQYLHLKEINVRSQIISGMMSYMISDMILDRLKKMCYLFLVLILDLPIGIHML